MKAAPADIAEDLAWLDENQGGAIEAAKRTGFPSVIALEKYAQRHDLSPLFQRLKARDPKGSHWAIKHHKENTVSDPIITVLHRADESPKAARRRKAERVRTLLAELRTELAADDEQQAAEAETRADIERLQGELNAAKAKLKGGSPATLSASSDASAIRAWAKANDVACAVVGRIPAEVRAAYDAAHAQESA